MAIESWLICLLTTKFRNIVSLLFKSLSTILLTTPLTTLLIHHFIYFTHVLKIPGFVFSSTSLSILVPGLGIFRALITAICGLKALFKAVEIL